MPLQGPANFEDAGDNGQLHDEAIDAREVPHGNGTRPSAASLKRHQLLERRLMLRKELEIVGLEKDRIDRIYDRIAEQLNQANIDIMCSDILDNPMKVPRKSLRMKIDG